jgi:sigma-54 dependent transcriptional regulator, acetoin dehydrogenase operon transcriptional activator AcoR
MTEPLVNQRPEFGACLPAQPFFSTVAQRVGLARQRFFDEGVRPSGLVAEPVIQSWARCLQLRRRPGDPVAFEPVGKSRINATLARNRPLLAAAQGDLGQLEATLSGTACKAILTDAHGVVVHATHSKREEGALMWLAGRVGVDLAEECVGTTAPGVVAKSGQSVVVHGAEHFFDMTRVLFCAAAPIRDARGELVAVLDLSCEMQPFRFDAASVVRLYATAIENRLLSAQSRQHVLLRFQATASLLNTPFEGLAAVDDKGRLAWINAAGASLLAAPREQLRDTSAEEALGLGLTQLLAIAHSGRVTMQRVPNGLMLCLQAQLQAAGRRATATLETLPRPADMPAAAATSSIAPAAAPSAQPSLVADASLHEANRQLIDRALAACQGNVSRAARELGVSRGLIYRRLRQAGSPPAG